MTILQNLDSTDYNLLFREADIFILQRYRDLLTSILEQVSVIEGVGVPTIAAGKHAWYFDTATSKYYRNTDGGTTWVALN